MLGHLLHHELEVIEMFFSKACSWIELEEDAVAQKLDAMRTPSEDIVEDAYCSPHGPIELRNVVLRATVNELNALLESALSQKVETVTKSITTANGRFLLGLDRPSLVALLIENGIFLDTVPGNDSVLEIKELSESFKHRRGFRSLPKRSKAGEYVVQRSLIPGKDEFDIGPHEINAQQVARLINGARTFLEQLNARSFL